MRTIAIEVCLAHVVKAALVAVVVILITFLVVLQARITVQGEVHTPMSSLMGLW